MECPSCKEDMQKAMFVGYHICSNCDIDIEFTWQEKQSAEIWRFKRGELIRKQVRRDLINGRICRKRNRMER